MLVEQPMWVKRSLRGCIALFLVLGGFFLSPLEAVAQSDPLDKVRAANTHYDNGEFASALRLYREAYDQMGDARLLYRIGLSYEHVGNYRRARQFLEKYLEKDQDSPVRGRVEANIASLQRLEDSIQSILVIDTEPQGAQVFLYGYLGEAEGRTPAEIPVGAGINQVTLVFEGGQRLEVPIEVRAGGREERFFSIGTASRPSQEIASAEEIRPDPEVVDEPQELDPSQETSEEQAQWGEDDRPDDDEQRSLADDNVIPLPGSEPEQRRPIQLDYVDIGPPRLALVSSVVLMALGGLSLYSGVIVAIRQATDPDDTDFQSYSPTALLVTGALLSGGGFYLLGRRWRSQLPPISSGMGRASVPQELTSPLARPASPGIFQLSLDF